MDGTSCGGPGGQGWECSGGGDSGRGVCCCEAVGLRHGALGNQSVQGWCKARCAAAAVAGPPRGGARRPHLAGRLARRAHRARVYHVQAAVVPAVYAADNQLERGVGQQRAVERNHDTVGCGGGAGEESCGSALASGQLTGAAHCSQHAEDQRSSTHMLRGRAKGRPAGGLTWGAVHRKCLLRALDLQLPGVQVLAHADAVALRRPLPGRRRH